MANVHYAPVADRLAAAVEDASRKMTVFEATMIAEGNWDLAGYEPDEETQIEAWQLLVDTGTCWQLQGWFGRQAAALIEAGVVEA